MKLTIYKVIDIQAGNVMGGYSTRKAASRKADRLDLEHGAIRYSVRAEEPKIIIQARDLSIKFQGRKVFVHTQPGGYNLRFDAPIETTKDFKRGLLKSRTIGFAIGGRVEYE